MNGNPGVQGWWFGGDAAEVAWAAAPQFWQNDQGSWGADPDLWPANQASFYPQVWPADVAGGGHNVEINRFCAQEKKQQTSL